MLRKVLPLIFISACSMGTVNTGGEQAYVYDSAHDYSVRELKTLSSDVVTTSHRDPPVEKLDRLFAKDQRPLKRVAILVFESIIQPTRSGLAGEDKIYLSEQGKQLLTERLLNIWEEAFPVLSEGVEYVQAAKVMQSLAFKKYGMKVDDYIKGRRTSIAPDDIFFREKGQKTTSATVLNPRGMRDLSLALVPATSLMQGPKWSEHQKLFVNAVTKELGLDGAIIVMSELSWSASHMEKHSGAFMPEEIKVKLSASTLVSLTEYHQRLRQLGNQEYPNVTLCYRAYQGELRVPVEISLPEEKQNFASIQSNLLGPLLKTYKDLTIMTVNQMSEDIRKTF